MSTPRPKTATTTPIYTPKTQPRDIPQQRHHRVEILDYRTPAVEIAQSPRHFIRGMPNEAVAAEMISTDLMMTTRTEQLQPSSESAECQHQNEEDEDDLAFHMDDLSGDANVHIAAGGEDEYTRRRLRLEEWLDNTPRFNDDDPKSQQDGGVDAEQAALQAAVGPPEGSKRGSI
ncbi:hypothetical protein AC578_4113 [Pseudocercospora eumusae]|uniref:Uncharacterized protein n=1 Tax=Pseudocercospora eumusae TaxID=321146 RepID=A0A139HF55_9PEZI|nr:hypothetical protein AC578_4113 [Pseudocercospora eumusae]